MNILSDISDEEFVPFLSNLGVETYKKSFDWMLGDPDFANVLRWIYNSLDQNNILTAREEYRYLELKKRGALLSPEDLKNKITEIKHEYPGICLPGDKDSMSDVTDDIIRKKDRYMMLEKHEDVLTDIIRKNEKVNQELNVEIANLNAALQQCSDDETSVGEECLTLAEELETLTNVVVEQTANALNLYGNCHTDMEIAKLFFTYGPLDSYKQSQASFKSHFDLFTSKKLVKKYNDFEMNKDIHVAPIEAEKMEERLANALCAYVKSKAELCGEQAKLALVANLNNIHPSQISGYMREAQTAVALLEQEEAVLDQELQSAVLGFVERRTRLVMEPTARSALTVREEILCDLRNLHSLTQQALCIDKIVYRCLRNELHSTEQLLHFAAQLRDHLTREASAVACRVKSMCDICTEQERVEEKLQASDVLLDVLVSILGGSPGMDPVKLYSEVKTQVAALKENIQDGLQQIEGDLKNIQNLRKPLRDYIWDGCTKKPNCSNRVVSSLRHQLKQEMDTIDERVIKTSGLFNSVKNGDKQNLRKLWQWFLTDQGRFLAAIKNVQ